MSNAIKNYTDSLKNGGSQTTKTRHDEVQNNAGGFVFEVSDRSRLERFLVLGADGGTFYVSEKKLIEQDVAFLVKMICEDAGAVVDTLVDFADNNRAPKNSTLLFVLALVMTHGENQRYVRESDVFNKVVRTGTHLFEITGYLKALGGMGRAKRSAIANWYESKTPDQLAYQAVKYRQRSGWTHRDVFRIVHPKGLDRNVGDFILGRGADSAPDVIVGFQKMQKATTAKQAIAILNEYKGLPWETIPTELLNDATVWKTLFYNGALGQTALIRNVTRLEKIGAFNDIKFSGDVAIALSDPERIVKGRVHPVQYANALGVYTNGPVTGNGYGYRTPQKYNATVAGSLEDGFYRSFKTVTPANKATMVSVDVSGSMTWGAPAGLVGMNYLEAAAVMAMVTVRTEPYAVINAFSTTMQEVNVSGRDTLAAVISKFRGIRMGATDVAAPMVYAKERGIEVDTFAVYTDNETWAGKVKPYMALRDYRKSTGRDARLAVVALAGTQFTVADPNDSGMMDFVGFDASAPKLLADFSAGRI